MTVIAREEGVKWVSIGGVVVIQCSKSIPLSELYNILAMRILESIGSQVAH